MKPEALDALTSETIRPTALEAATTKDPNENMTPPGKDLPHQQQPHTHNDNDGPDTPTKLSTPFGERTDGTKSAVKLVEEVVQGVKAAVDGALAWAEKKVEELGSEQDATVGPYTSPATCMPSDLDVIASGILPAIPTNVQYDGNDEDGEKAQKKDQEKG
ncbi:hypothetical protein EJ02DRAFT_502778 [Clathrospora elynae]|uniref:Uncharacterized protein n=1 Tax=Clathrospora elynae TaxID=706981 RepID=A0A6A5SPJ2_9PLEO|nr:hypothetical protein EJ02DRAFT_502778 [Clathrospora elynae]